MWHEYLSMDMFAFSSKCGALMFFALTVTLYTVLAARPVQTLQDIKNQDFSLQEHNTAAWNMLQFCYV